MSEITDDLYSIAEQIDRVSQTLKTEDDRETVAGALLFLAHSLNEENEGGIGTKIAWIGSSLERIADALERLSPSPTKVTDPREA